MNLNLLYSEDSSDDDYIAERLQNFNLVWIDDEKIVIILGLVCKKQFQRL